MSVVNKIELCLRTEDVVAIRPVNFGGLNIGVTFRTSNGDEITIDLHTMLRGIAVLQVDREFAAQTNDALHSVAFLSPSRRGDKTMKADEVMWIVNHNGELGVKVGNQCFFMYKAKAFEYDEAQAYRQVGKREFGESGPISPAYTEDPENFHKTTGSAGAEWHSVHFCTRDNDGHCHYCGRVVK